MTSKTAESSGTDTSTDRSTHSAAPTSRRVAVSGASGLVGQALCQALNQHGYRAVPMVRGDASAGEIAWDPAAGSLRAADLDGVDAVVHLAGENVFGRWTDAKKARIVDSRVEGTGLIARTLAQLAEASAAAPKQLVCASAIGFYGDRGDQVLTETSSAGDGFLADVCVRWEAAAEPARQAGLAVSHLRFGIVLSKDGGALEQMLLPFRLGVGGKIGDGRQWMSWIHIDDLVAQILHVLDNDLEGIWNAVAPEPVRNADFTKTLGDVLHRPTVLPLPGIAAKLAMGEMADEMLLGSTRVVPAAFGDTDFRFHFSSLRAALEHELSS